MLALDDDRWQQLTTFYGEPKDVPRVLDDWIASIGFDQEDTIYRRDLFDVFLHQATITNAAFAIVPYLVHACRTSRTKYRIEYLTDVALVEANRIKHGLYFNRQDTEAYPTWLMPDYHEAIIEARNLVDDAMDDEPDAERKRGLVAMTPALYGNAELAWSQW